MLTAEEDKENTGLLLDEIAHLTNSDKDKAQTFNASFIPRLLKEFVMLLQDLSQLLINSPGNLERYQSTGS